MNKLILAGEIVEKGDVIMMTTTEFSSDGREFTEDHEIHFAKKKDSASIKAGDKIRVMGHLKRNDDNITIIEILSPPEKHEDDDDLNVARIVGKAHRTFEFYPRAEGRVALGNLLVTVENTIYRGVAFGHLAHTLHRNCSKGSDVQLEGRLRTREYEDRDGDMQSMLEIVADPDFTKVLKKAAIVDRFEQYEEKTKEAI